MTRISDVVDMTFGFAFKSAEFSDDPTDVPLLRGDNIAQGRLRWGGAKRFPRTRVGEVERYQLAVGDVVIAMDRPWIEAGLKYSVVREEDVPSLLVQRVARLRTKSDSLDQGFLGAVIGSAAFASYVIGVQTGSAVPHISGGQIGDFEFKLPHVEEQQAIAGTLGVLDNKIESNLRSIDLIDQLVRARFDHDFDIEMSPAGTPLSDLFDVNVRRKLSRGSEATYVGMSALPEFSPTVYEWDIRAFGAGQKFVNGDVLMARITPCLENGKTAVVDMLNDGEVGWGSTEYIVLSPSGEFSTPWIYALVRNNTLREWAIRRMTGSSGRQRFQASGFDEYRIGAPPPRALSAFNSFAVPLFDRMTSLRDETRRLTALRDALLPELLSGRISPTELEGQPG